MKIIGLTGGIGTGKSTVSEYLVFKGYNVLDADKISREIVEPGSETLNKLRSVFGDEIILENGSLDRKKLGQIVFSDPEKRKILDDMMHSKILEIMLQKIRMYKEAVNNFGRDGTCINTISKTRVIFIDAPLLFETGLDKFVSEIWVVDADDETRIQRIMERDGLNRSEILERFASQMDRQEKNKRADEILDNSGAKQELYQQIEKLLQRI